MSEETKKKRIRKFKIPDDYIPIDCWKEAKDFFLSIRDDVDIYKKFKCFSNLKKSEEADKFVIWWEFERFADNPRSLILINENLDDINEKVNSCGFVDGYEQLQFKLIQFYRLLKENGMINE